MERSEVSRKHVCDDGGSKFLFGLTRGVELSQKVLVHMNSGLTKV